MNIVHIIPAYKPAYIYGGPTVSASFLCEALASKGMKIDVLATTANGKFEFEIADKIPVKIDGVNVYYFKRITGDHSHISPSLWWTFFKNIHKYDLVILASWWNPLIIICALICKLKRKRFILIPHGMFSNYTLEKSLFNSKRLFQKTIGNFLLKKSILHFTSDVERNSVNLLLNNEYYMLPNLYQLPPKPNKHTNNKRFTIGSFSRVHPIKRIDIMMRAFAKLEFECVLKIAGTGDENYIVELKELALQLGISDKVEWVGWLSGEGKLDFLQSVDVVALLSYSENFANTVLDAVSQGKPVVITEGVGLCNWVRTVNAGIVVTSEVQTIAAAFLNVYTQKTKFELDEDKGWYLVKKDFEAETVIDRYIDKYKQIAKFS